MDRQQRPCDLNKAKQELHKNIKTIKSSLATYFFILDTKGAGLRKKILISAFFSLWLFLSVILLYNTDFSLLLGRSFQYLFTYPPLPENPINALLNLLIVEIGPMTIYFFVIVLTPFLLAYRAAVKYLTDIYELEDEEIASKFIWQAAFAQQYDSISIADGEIVDKDKNSPIVRIGGPGIIKVDLCSAALFEKPNGRPHVIGPKHTPMPKKLKKTQKLLADITKKIQKTKKSSSKDNVIQGFERFRYAKNLHDEALLPIEVESRSLDGIPVIAKDVRLFYSIWRGEPSEEEKKSIYPYRKEAIPSFFYNASCRVSEIQEGGCNISPVDPMQGIVERELKNFISQHPLSEFLTSAGEPEKAELKKHALDYQNEKAFINRTKKTGIDYSDKKFRTPKFSSRAKINPLLNKFADEFSISNRQKGVELYWLGTGTWVVPEKTIEEKNEEAQKIMRENAKKGSPKSLEKVESSAKHDEILRLIRLVPLQSTRNLYAPYFLRERMVEEILENYIELIKSAQQIADAYEDEYADTEKIIRVDASKKIYNAIHSHWIGKPIKKSGQKPEPPAVG